MMIYFMLKPRLPKNFFRLPEADPEQYGNNDHYYGRNNLFQQLKTTIPVKYRIIQQSQSNQECASTKSLYENALLGRIPVNHKASICKSNHGTTKPPDPGRMNSLRA
jgi:hypothetical protein